MNRIGPHLLRLSIAFFLLSGINGCFGQTAIWIEDFDDGGAGRWTVENAPGSLTNPTPAGITGLTYGVNAAVAHDNFIINDRNTPQLDGDILIGTIMSAQGQFVRGRHYACASPSDLPNPFINQAAAGPNQSLHITAYPTCATLLYGGTAQSDDWNCISDPDNGDTQTQTEQIAFLTNNIDASTSCNLVLSADFFLGGDADGIKSHASILYSTDAGVTWKILEDHMKGCNPFLAGTCNNWSRRSYAFPSDADGQADLRIAFRWYDDGDIENTGDYALGASFNVDNVIITTCDAPNTAFSADHTSGCKNETFVFTDETVVDQSVYINCASILSGVCDINTWAWSFSPATVTFVNGTTAASQNPEVQFNANGNYDVTLTASSCAGGTPLVQNNMITIADCPPIANFITSSTAACAVPASAQDTVSFTDLSTTPTTPITNWTWTFTPATVTYRNGTNANSQNIDVTFDAAGTYQVALQVTSSEGTDTETKTAYIQAIDCNCGGGGGGGPTSVFAEDFDGNGGAGSNWAVTNEDIGAQGDIPNQWYISDQEAGTAVGTCGTSGGGDQTLHVSSCPCWVGDLGAAYEIGAGFCGFIPGVCPVTDKRSYSNAITTTGVTGLTLTFQYMEAGEGTTDDATVLYSINNGGTWLTLDNPAKTVPCGAQGTWTAYSFPLPVTCENITTLRIGFRWVNNDGGGVDPSFAVDDIDITGTGGGGGTANTWEGDVSTVWNLAGNWSDGTIPTATDDLLVPQQSDLCATCVMPTISAPAVGQNVCNFGVITIQTNNTLTIDEDLLNEGVIVTTTVNPNADVIFANSASIYKGSGTLFDVDVAVTSSDLTLETNMTPRSLTINTTGTVDLDVYALSVNRDLTKLDGTFTAVNGSINLIDACGTCLDLTNTTNVSLDANQVFGDVLVNKTPGIKASMVSAFNYTLNTPKTLTIQNGILDANTSTLNGTGNITMTGGELQLAKCATTLPEVTGTYTLTAGRITFDGTCAQTVKPTATLGTNYVEVEFAGTGIKTISGNTNIADSLIFNLPTTLGNYITVGTDTVFALNSSAGIVRHVGGHVLGDFNRSITSSGGDYVFYVGSDNSDGETYYEPIRLTPNALTGPSSVTAEFLDATPNPTTVVPEIYFGFSPTIDTIQQVETEGYWHLDINSPVTGGNYTAWVSPDINYWTFTETWGSGQYTLLKQSTTGDSWDYTAGGTRYNDSTTGNFVDFSNYALGYAKNNPLPMPLAVDLIYANAYCENQIVKIAWTTASETNSAKFIVEASDDGIEFHPIGEVTAAGNSTEIRNYSFSVDQKTNSGSFFRISELDYDGTLTNFNILHAACEDNTTSFDADLYPNPNQGSFNLNVFSSDRGIGTITIIDITGKIVQQKKNLRINEGLGLSSHDVNLQQGLYIILIEFKNFMKSIRMNITN